MTGGFIGSIDLRSDATPNLRPEPSKWKILRSVALNGVILTAALAYSSFLLILLPPLWLITVVREKW
tara:strand:- start:251 stop:451 length:201 start_codon:yes stop_codon:yes gene_type:complete